MQGQRLPDAHMGDPGPGWQAWRDPRGKLIAPPGAYMKVILDGGIETWYIVDPFGNAGALGEHRVTEHEDGTITVEPSILDNSSGGWHGYLVAGVWTEAV